MTIPTDGNNKFKPSAWDDATTTWSTYTYTPPTFYIAGNFVTPPWSVDAAANKMDYADGVCSKSYDNVPASTAHQFKITNGTWDNAIGYDQNKCSGTNCTVEDGGSNIKFTSLAEGTVTITYTLADGKVHITCPEPPAAEFNITYPATQTNYTLVPGPAKAQTGAEVSFTATPAEGYVLNVTYNGNTITGNNNVYTFMMPATDVTVAITAVTATTLYYVDNNNWGKANAYMWSDNGNNGSWPGAAMALVGTVGYNAYSYYSISFAQGAYTSIIFNNGSGSQIGDLTINPAKPYFYDDAWYTWDELLAKLAAPVVTYDYYITGSFNGDNPKKAENGMTLDGTVYKATVTLAAGDNMLKVTDGTWDHTWGYGQLGAAYEEVSDAGEYNKIKITLAAEKEITVIFDATEGKITFEGLLYLTCYLMGNGDWVNGVEMTLNPNNNNEYMLLDHYISAPFKFKLGDEWSDQVDNYDFPGIAWADDNIILPDGYYDFYFKKDSKKVYIANATDTYTRDVTNKFGTICLPYTSVSTTGATFYEVCGKETGKVYLVSVTKLDAGMPYIFEATASPSQIKVVYNKNTKVATADVNNGLKGTFEDETVVPANNYILYNNAFIPADGTTNKVNAYRAYLNMDAVQGGKPTQTMPGRRYIGMSVQGENETTGVEDLFTTDAPVKVIENGQFIIIRDGVKYNVQGQKL